MTDAPDTPAILLVRSGGARVFPEWRAAFADALPGVEVRAWDDPAVDPDHVAYVLVWEPEPGRLARYKNLRLIFSSAAGIDHITRDPHLPRDIPIVRMGAEEMAQTVGEYVCLAALMILRDLPRILAGQAAATWDTFEGTRTALSTRVGIMGMGLIGSRAANMLRGVGFPVHGWSRTRRDVPGARGFSGMADLPAFLAETEILVGLLPATPETRGLLNAARLNMLPRGAGIINAGRGTLIVMPDLIAALDSGRIGRAVLDVFETEPLPPDDPAWRHPKIVVTPHVAGYATRPARARAVAEGIARYLAGAPIANLYDPARGY